MLVHIVWLWVLLLFLYKLYLYSIFSMFYHVVYNGERNFLFEIMLYNKILICWQNCVVKLGLLANIKIKLSKNICKNSFVSN